MKGNWKTYDFWYSSNVLSTLHTVWFLCTYTMYYMIYDQINLPLTWISFNTLMLSRTCIIDKNRIICRCNWLWVSIVSVVHSKFQKSKLSNLCTQIVLHVSFTTMCTVIASRTKFNSMTTQFVCVQKRQVHGLEFLHLWSNPRVSWNIGRKRLSRAGVTCNLGARNLNVSKIHGLGFWELGDSLHSRLMQIDFQIFEKFISSHDDKMRAWLDVKLRTNKSLVELVTGSSERQSCARVW